MGTHAVILIAMASILSSVPVLAFDAVKTSRNAAGLAIELANLGVYGSQRAVIVRNQANDWLRIWCSSRDDSTGEKRLEPGESLSFAFSPKVIGGYTVFWCSLDYKTYWARWDVFGGTPPYGKDKENDKAYVYEVRHDGVYYDGHKFRGLAEGHHKYTLWEDYDGNMNPLGNSLNGFVDGGMCNNLPNYMEGKVSAASLCDDTCITLYSDLHCRGQTSRLQTSGGCTNFWFSFFNDRPKSVQGC